MKILLIDDEAENGWKEVIEKVLFMGELIFSISELPTAQEILSNEEFDLIFLDLRYGENDHYEPDISKYGGYKLLTEFIRGAFANTNFSTPVMLFTATNKAWNIFEMIECGADDFYIKEHPDTAYDLEFSRKNYERLKKGIPNLIELGKRRRIIWQYIQDIISQTQLNIQNQNIKKRIEEKLKIGYGLLFRRTTRVENEQLLFNNEIISFIVFWSILEEISHDYYCREDEKAIEWVLNKVDKKIQFEDSNGNLKTLFQTIKEEFNTSSEITDLKYAHQVNLSNQIAGILRYQLIWNHSKIRLHFIEKLNNYRNKVDFIHGSTDSINNDSLESNQNSNEGFEKCRQILDFLKILIG